MDQDLTSRAASPRTVAPDPSPRTSGVFVALLVLLLLVGEGVGCQKDCDIEPGTPATDLPLLHGSTRGDGCYPSSGPDEMRALSCCRFPVFVLDGGVVECPGLGVTVDCTQLAPAEFFWLGTSYGGRLCDPGGSSESEWICGVFVRDGRVVGGCRDCPPD